MVSKEYAAEKVQPNPNPAPTRGTLSSSLHIAEVKPSRTTSCVCKNKIANPL
jgi:hypothetical protein